MAINGKLAFLLSFLFIAHHIPSSIECSRPNPNLTRILPQHHSSARNGTLLLAAPTTSSSSTNYTHIVVVSSHRFTTSSTTNSYRNHDVRNNDDEDDGGGGDEDYHDYGDTICSDPPVCEVADDCRPYAPEQCNNGGICLCGSCSFLC